MNKGYVYLIWAERSWSLATEIAESVSELGHGVISQFLVPPSSRGVEENMYASIREADAVVALLDGATPNVFVEVGVALGLGKPVLVVGGTEELPWDLATLPYLPTGTSERWWESGLSGFLSQALGDADRDDQYGTAAGEGLSRFSSLAREPKLLDVMRHSDIADLVSELLREEGYETVQKEVRLGDSTILRPDVTASHADGRMVIAECKASPMGAPTSVDAIQQLEGYLRAAAPGVVGVVVTTGRFADAAYRYAESSPSQIELWDRYILLEKLSEAIDPSMT